MRDISGREIPESTRRRATSIERVIAVAPVRDVPNDRATEFMVSGYATIAAAAVPGVWGALLDPSTGNAFAYRVPPSHRARISEITVWCPDMVASAVPYLFARMTINTQPSGAWGFIPVYPRNGVASLSFPAAAALDSKVIVGLEGKNHDPTAAAHLLVVFLYGWFWPTDIDEG